MAHHAPGIRRLQRDRTVLAHKRLGRRVRDRIGQLAFDDTGINADDPQRRMFLAQAGITFAPEDCLRAHFDDGSLVPLPEVFLPPTPGFFLYFPQRRNMMPKLRALIDHVRQWQAG